ncbi:MAG: hypothetical protein ACPHCN_15775 [Mycobacterium sp.]
MSSEAPIDIDRNEVRFEGPVHKVNGWECGQIAQQMGREFRERFDGRRIKRASLRLSVWVETDAELEARTSAQKGGSGASE